MANLDTGEFSRPVGFGIVGLGMIAGFHARALAETTGAKLVGVVAREAAKAQAFAAQHGGGWATDSVEELVARADIDVVIIATPSGAHLEPALAAIRAGKHVLVEKPIEISVERTDALLAAADAAGVQVGAIFQSRFGAGAQALKAAVDAGRFGRFVLASANVKWHRAADYYRGWKGTLALDGGAVLINQGIHTVDLLQWLAGMPETVAAWTARRVHTQIEGEDTMTAMLRFPHGALGTIEATTAAWPGWQRRIELCGENGSALLEDDRLVRWDFRDVQPGDEAVRASAVAEGAPSGGAGAANQISYAGHQRQIADFVAAVRTGKRVAVDGREARKAVALVRAIYESAAAGGAVTRVAP
ncbi:Gfo/Idh/MocA family oxidoreductase [Horticoccus luteus]|uniref:Gfo/Idh/MocA family oxidoreductase n=1 Tax=Horticoccus luteus TaxID=2862869 RepID=A0A8F9XK09_9BACT|nr:Gfo/Idh/MocA family oxidoreductase [Horticoccus luteus]QYM79223.1 Gfo/Idh/MocA family oxidoreductase [Horticoccus luteus]